MLIFDYFLVNYHILERRIYMVYFQIQYVDYIDNFFDVFHKIHYDLMVEIYRFLLFLVLLG